MAEANVEKSFLQQNWRFFKDSSVCGSAFPNSSLGCKNKYCLCSLYAVALQYILYIRLTEVVELTTNANHMLFWILFWIFKIIRLHATHDDGVDNSGNNQANKQIKKNICSSTFYFSCSLIKNKSWMHSYIISCVGRIFDQSLNLFWLGNSVAFIRSSGPKSLRIVCFVETSAIVSHCEQTFEQVLLFSQSMLSVFFYSLSSLFAIISYRSSARTNNSFANRLKHLDLRLNVIK